MSHVVMLVGARGAGNSGFGMSNAAYFLSEVNIYSEEKGKNFLIAADSLDLMKRSQMSPRPKHHWHLFLWTLEKISSSH